MSTEGFTPLTLPRIGQASADERVDSERRRGYAAGYAAGQRAAHLEAEEAAALHQEKVEEESAAARAAVGTLHAAAGAFADRAAELAALDEERVMALAVELAEHILRAQLADPVRAAATTATRVSAAVEGFGDATVQLNASDAAALGAEITANFTVSAELDPGDVVVTYPHGQVDLRVTAAVARIRDALAGVTR